MRDSKLFSLLRTFESHEWKDFRRYISSRVREDAEVLKVYDYILKYRQNLDQKKLDSKHAKGALFSKKTDKNFQNLISQIHSHVLDYFSIEYILKDDINKHLILFRSLKDRELYQEAKRTQSKALNELEASPVDLWNPFYRHLLLHHEEYLLNPLKTQDDSIIIKKLLAAWNDYKAIMDKFYETSLTHKRLVGRLDNEDLKDNITLNTISDEKQTSHLYNILDALNQLNGEESERSYSYLYGCLLSSDLSLHTTIQTVILENLIQYQERCIRFNKESLQGLIELYNYGINNQLILISETRIIIVVHIFAILGKFRDARMILKTLLADIKTDKEEQILQLSSALLLFYEKKYAAANNIILTTAFNDQKIRNGVRLLKIMIDYETVDDKNYLLNNLDNLQAYIRRHNSQNSYSLGVRNFIYVVRKLSKDESSISLEELTTITPLVRRLWLKKKIKEKMELA